LCSFFGTACVLSLVLLELFLWHCLCSFFGTAYVFLWHCLCSFFGTSYVDLTFQETQTVMPTFPSTFTIRSSL
jgi:hypothetical protein